MRTNSRRSSPRGGRAGEERLSTPPAPRPVRVYETVLYASDVAATAAFYSDILRLRLLEDPDELSAVFRLDDGGVLLLFDPDRSSAPGRPVPSHGATGPGHVALSVAPSSLDAIAAELHRRGIEIERELSWDEGGRSLYVRDPAGNSVELIEGEAWLPY
ncbi:MAG: VOC family protein [Actinomycetota bacterium]|nr:VOC family protein [Actinomycetota bacterium]